jgi:DNA-directed RNA polymerase subunit H (RpoH/RPB5)
MKKILENKKTLLLFIVGIGVIVILFNLYNKNQNLEFQIYSAELTPDIELYNALSFDSQNIASGEVVGFISFYFDIDKQPKNFRQYVKIIPSNNFDEEGKQIFYEIDIIKMDNLAIRYFDPVVLAVKEIKGDEITLTDKSNNLFIINKRTQKIGMSDSTGDQTVLLTSESSFRDFQSKLLK